jgi:hypothetical protein
LIGIAAGAPPTITSKPHRTFMPPPPPHDRQRVGCVDPWLDAGLASKESAVTDDKFLERASCLHAICDCACKLLGERDQCPHCGMTFPQTTSDDRASLLVTIKKNLETLADAEIEGVDDCQATHLLNQLVRGTKALHDWVAKARRTAKGWLLLLSEKYRKPPFRRE